MVRVPGDDLNETKHDRAGRLSAEQCAVDSLSGKGVFLYESRDVALQNPFSLLQG